AEAGRRPARAPGGRTVRRTRAWATARVAGRFRNFLSIGLFPPFRPQIVDQVADQFLDGAKALGLSGSHSLDATAEPASRLLTRLEADDERPFGWIPRGCTYAHASRVPRLELRSR